MNGRGRDTNGHHGRILPGRGGGGRQKTGRGATPNPDVLAAVALQDHLARSLRIPVANPALGRKTNTNNNNNTTNNMTRTTATTRVTTSSRHYVPPANHPSRVGRSATSGAASGRRQVDAARRDAPEEGRGGDMAVAGTEEAEA